MQRSDTFGIGDLYFSAVEHMGTVFDQRILTTRQCVITSYKQLSDVIFLVHYKPLGFIRIQITISLHEHSHATVCN